MKDSREGENVGPCFCVELCSEDVHIGCGVSCEPHWQKVWDFDIHPDAGAPGSQFSVDGYAGGPNALHVFGDMNYRGGVLLRYARQVGSQALSICAP